MGKPATTDTREIIVEILLDLEKGQDFSHQESYRGYHRETAGAGLLSEPVFFRSGPQDEASDPLSAPHEYLSDPVYGCGAGQCGMQ